MLNIQNDQGVQSVLRKIKYCNSPKSNSLSARILSSPQLQSSSTVALRCYHCATHTCFNLQSAERKYFCYGSHVYPDSCCTTPSSVVDTRHRTAYHFQPPKNWINDPNGPMYYNGYYHFFYQYNPKSAVWDSPYWGHSISKDLINWVALENAIEPSKPFDIKGCWSGSATILPGNKPVILYTGNNYEGKQVQNIAFPKNLSDPYLREWVKPDYNPIITPTTDINSTEFRDPTTAWLGLDKIWRLIIGSQQNHKGMAILYRSKDFIHWTRANRPLHSSKTVMWECPDFYPVGKSGKLGFDVSARNEGLKYVMKASLDSTGMEYYTIGMYDRKKDVYVPDKMAVDNSSGLRYDYGKFYASKSFYDAKGKRRVLFGWSNEGDSRQDDLSKGWAGIQSVPRTLWLDPSGRQLVQWPVKELNKLRGKQVSMKSQTLRSQDYFEVSDIMTDQTDVEMTFQLSDLEKANKFNSSWTDPQKICKQNGANVTGGVGPFGLLTLASHHLVENTAVYFLIFKAPTKYIALMCHDSSRSSLKTSVDKPIYGGFVDIDIKKNGMLSLRTLIDHSVVESFGANGKTCILSRVYPTLALGDASRLFVFNNGKEDVKIPKLNAWEMKKPLMNGA